MNERGRLTKIRNAFVMAVHAGAEQECDKRHNPVRPQLEKVLKDHGRCFI